MEKLEQLKAMLKELSPEEVEELKAFLNYDTEDTPTEDTSKTDEAKDDDSENTTPAEEENAPAEPSTETPADETSTPVDEPSPEAKEDEGAIDNSVPAQENAEDSNSEEQASEDTPTDESVPTDDSDEDVPMQKIGGDLADDDVVDSSITAEDGEKLPVDYNQVIDGLQAKITALEAEKNALEAENTALKSKVEGAFGYSSKVSAPTKVNRLYDDAIDEIHMHR